VLLVGSFEDETEIRASLGSTGSFPQQSQLTINIGAGAVTYHFDVPAEYQPGRPAPLIAVLHGAAGPGGQSFAAADTRDAWALAGLGDAVIVAPESSGNQGGWIPSTDLVKLQAVIVSARSRYNIDLNRIYGWGFSAGAHTMHSFALAGAPNLFAGYSVSAGALQAIAGVNAPQQAPRKAPLHIHQGINDGVVPFNIVQADVVRFQNAGWISANVQGQNLFFESFDGGHEFESAHAARIWANLCRFAEVPVSR
jgi:predicted peptidase